MKSKKSLRVRAERGYGPRHMMNAQEGSDAVPSELPSPPDWVEEARLRQRRGVPGVSALQNLDPRNVAEGIGGELAGLSKEDVAKLAISMLAGGEGEMPVPGKAVAPKLAHTQAVKVTWPDGLVHYDEIGGADQADALRRAQENWEGAKIEPVGEVPLKYGLGNSRYEGLGALTPEDALDADYLNDLKTKHSLGQLPQPGPLDRPYLPPEGFKRGKVAVAKGFGPGHAENSKEGEDLTKVNTDTVPAMLTPRESVLNRNASELAGRDNIEKLNSEGNQLARNGVDLAAGGMADVKEKIMKSKPKSSKPASSGSPYVQAFQNLMPKGGAPVGYQGGGGNVGGTDPLPPAQIGGMGGGLGARDQYGRQFSNRDASGAFGAGNGMPGAGVVGVPGGPYGTRNDTGPGVIGGPMGGGPFPGRGPGGVYPGAMPGMQGPGTPPTQQGPFQGRGPGGVYPSGPQPIPLADGSSNVGPIGTPPQGEQAYGPPVNLTAPQIQQLAKQTGISPTQIMGLMKAFQGGKDIYNSVGTGGYDTASPETSQAVGDAFGFGAQGMQGGISDIGYPPFVAPSASYDGNRGGWLGPYDPSFMIQRYAGGTSYVSPFR